uniref:Uncharacterized protein n=1 Tax=Globisporangium ultimum (strain ATCC 200006 / CBS 805.95 / DAOM BR144) TaxID=431595 RepID=K3X0W1_GLOUD
MQRERLEGWMVRQIENADLAKATVLQLPARTSAVTYTQHGAADVCKALARVAATKAVHVASSVC